MTERARKILDYLRSQKKSELEIRQQTLAEEFKCSRRTIGRCLKELKEANLLTDLNKRHKNRCKIYEIKIPLNPLTPAAQHQLKFYGRTFSGLFKMFDGKSGRPTFESCFAEVARELEHTTDETELYTKIFAGLWELPYVRECDISWRSEPENRNKGGITWR
ncbi:MAG: HTH domain-containing protein [Myxococcaceae bacterium]